MAALGKIRSRGVTLIVIIGFGLFAFIAEEAFRSAADTHCSGRNDDCQTIRHGWLIMAKDAHLPISGACSCR